MNKRLFPFENSRQGISYNLWLNLPNVLKKFVTFPFQLFIDEIKNSTVISAESNHFTRTWLHFASLKAVGESFENPLLYYDKNVNGLLNVLKSMKKSKCRKLLAICNVA